MNSKKKNIRKTSGTRNRYKPGQLVTINHHVFRIVKGRCRNDDCIHCFDYNCNRSAFKTNLKHKG